MSSWLCPFWDSTVEPLSRDGKYIYIYLIGKANSLGLVDYYMSQFLLDTREDREEFESALQELIQHELVISFGNQLLLTRYLWNRRQDPGVVRVAARIYDDLPTDQKTTIQLIPLKGLEYILTPELSEVSAETRRLGFDPTQYRINRPEPNPSWTKP